MDRQPSPLTVQLSRVMVIGFGLSISMYVIMKLNDEKN